MSSNAAAWMFKPVRAFDLSVWDESSRAQDLGHGMGLDRSGQVWSGLVRSDRLGLALQVVLRNDSLRLGW